MLTLRPFRTALLLGACSAWAACVSAPDGHEPAALKDGVVDAGSRDAAPDVPSTDDRRFDRPIDGITGDERSAFFAGDRSFGTPLREADGLGPLYTRAACSSCHENAARGPGAVQKMAVVDVDGFTPSQDQSALPFGATVRPLLAAGATIPLLPPADPRVRITTRVGPSVLGRGYVDAVLDAEIERMASEQASRSDGISGRVNHVRYTSETVAQLGRTKGESVVGRFGFKARIGTLEDFTADALQSDMGITSPLRPQELDNPEHLLDDAKPGVDVALSSILARADYLRLVAVPRRVSQSEAGAALFASTTCGVCHAPTLRTRSDYAVAAIAGVDAPIYSDLLLHDMGTALADGVVEGEASSREWRTTPLIGLRFQRTFLHDGRARSVEEAIALHAGDGSEAAGAVARFRALSLEDQRTLVTFVSGL